MAKEGNTAVSSSFWRDLLSVGIYKRSQGKIARQATFFVLLITVALGSYSLWLFMHGSQARYPVALGVFFAGVWLSFRLVNTSKFADFLISVEAEMNKVTWPSRSELMRSSLVVIITIFGLAAILLLYDTIWQQLLALLQVLPKGK